MSDHSELKRLAEAFPDYDYDSNSKPFFNGPSGESLGGGSTGFYCVYGPDFEIDGDRYDGATLVEVTTRDQAKFICEAKSGILALIAENATLRTGIKGDYDLDAWIDWAQEKAKLLAEVEALRPDAKRYRWIENPFAGLFGVTSLDEYIDAVMNKELAP